MQRSAFAYANNLVSLVKEKAIYNTSQAADREIEVIPKNVSPVAIVVPWTLNGS